ncbi:MAG: hypothetical protein JWM93_2728 [Frankiales bacterium]|nr:hypothetical protein [Frankiales bacterium]
MVTVVPIVAASFCPHPPVLIPSVAAGAAPELDDLRAACLASLHAATADCEQVILLGSGPRSVVYDDTSYGDLRPYGVDFVDGPVTAADDTDGTAGRFTGGPLPLSLTVGRWLLREAGWSGPTLLLAADGCGDFLWGTDEDPPRALVVMGDGSPSRSVAAPGYLDERAAPFDACVAAALCSGDPLALRGLDERLAVELGVAGWPAWKAASYLLADRRWRATMRYDEAPYGVGYFVADWRLAP